MDELTTLRNASADYEAALLRIARAIGAEHLTDAAILGDLDGLALMVDGLAQRVEGAGMVERERAVSWLRLRAEGEADFVRADALGDAADLIADGKHMEAS